LAEQSTDDEEAEALFDARRLAYPALERLARCSPRTLRAPAQVPAMLEQISAIAARTASDATVAHAGDGNLHPCYTPPGDSAAREAAQAAFEEFLDAAIALGGTVTGEHASASETDGMRRELDPARSRCRPRCATRSTRARSSTREGLASFLRPGRSYQQARTRPWPRPRLYHRMSQAARRHISTRCPRPDAGR